MRHDRAVGASSVPPKILGHEAAGTRRNPSRSSVSYIETPQPEEALMNGTEEIRFKAGDACCCILQQSYDVGPVRTRAHHWSATTAGTHLKRVWDGPSKSEFLVVAMGVLS